MSKKDLEEEHSRELQVEQAFKLFQEALQLHQLKEFAQSYRLYDELFKLDVLSNHYHEEADFIRGVQNGGWNQVPDEISFLSPNVKTLRYLVFRNRGLLYLDIMRNGTPLLTEEDTQSPEEKFKELFYTLVDDLCVSLFYQDADEVLLQNLYEIFSYLGIQRLTKLIIEYWQSRRDESEDLVPVSKSVDTKLSLLNKVLYLDISSKDQALLDKTLRRINDKWAFLLPIKQDYEAQIEKSYRMNNLTVKLDNVSWPKVIDALNSAVKESADSNKTQPRMKNVEPYLLTEEPFDRVVFELPSPSIAVLRLATPDPEVIVSQEEPDDVAKESKEDNVEPAEDVSEEVKDDRKETEAKEETKTQRSSKRLARTEIEMPAVELKSEFFQESTRFFQTLNQLISTGVNFNDVVVAFMGKGDIYATDFVDLLNNWQSSYTRALISESNSTTATNPKADAEKLKLVEVLNNFNTFVKPTSTEEIPPIDDTDLCAAISEFLMELNESHLHYEDVKVKIIERLVGLNSEGCYLVDTTWSSKLFLLVKEWILQFDETLRRACRQRANIEQLALATSVMEILLDSYVSIKTQISSLVLSSKRTSHTRSTINSLSRDLLRFNDKLKKWSMIYEDAYFNKESEATKLSVSIHVRFLFCILQKERASSFALENNEIAINRLHELIDLVRQWNLTITLPNYENFTEISEGTLKTQLTSTSALAMFLKILYSDGDANRTEAISLLESIFADTLKDSIEGDEDMTDVPIHSIQAFLDNSVIDMKLSLWSVLFLYYDADSDFSKMQLGFGHFLKYLKDYLCSNSYKEMKETERKSALAKIIGFIAETTKLYISKAASNKWKITGPVVSEALVFFIELLYIFLIHEEAALITVLKSSVRLKSKAAYEQLKETLVGLFCVFILNHCALVPEKTVELYSLVHNTLGFRRLCSNLEFLRLGHDILSHKNDSSAEIAQIISCRYHYLIPINNFTPKDHETEQKQELDQALGLAKFALPLCFKQNPMIHLPKHGLKLLIEEFYEAVGDPVYDLLEILRRNLASFDHFLDTTRITPRLMRDSFYGTFTIDLEYPDSVEYDGEQGGRTSDGSISPAMSAVLHGVYFLQALLVFSSYKVRRKNMQSRIVELEHVIMLLKNDVIHGSKRMESWFALGLAYGFLVEDDLIWTADKLTVPERKAQTANLQRKSLICYLMAISLVEPTEQGRYKPIIGSLMSQFAKEMYSACMEPMNMHAFEAQPHPKFLKSNQFVSVVKSPVSRTLCCKIMQQSLHLAVKANPKDWVNYYYLAKVQKKLGKSPDLILETLAESLQFTQQTDHVIEPHYSTCSMVYKYVKRGDLSPEEGFSYLAKDPVVGKAVIEERQNQVEGNHDKENDNVSERDEQININGKLAENETSKQANGTDDNMTEKDTQITDEKDTQTTDEKHAQPAEAGNELSNETEAKVDVEEAATNETTDKVEEAAVQETTDNTETETTNKEGPKSVENMVIDTPQEVNASSIASKNEVSLEIANGKMTSTTFTKTDFYRLIIVALKTLDDYDKKNWHHKPRYRLARVLYEEFGDIKGAIQEMNNFMMLKQTSKSLILIWKPDNERPGKHFYYTYEYCRFFIELLTKNLDVNSLVQMLPKLKRSNSIMINLYTIWEMICSSICKIVRVLLKYDEGLVEEGVHNFKFTDRFIQVVPYLTFTSEFQKLLDNLKAEGMPKNLKAYFSLLHSLNDIKKANNGFGPTSLIDDTLVCTFLRIYLYYLPNILALLDDLVGGKIKKLAKRDIFPFVLDILGVVKKGLDGLLQEDPDIINNYIREMKQKNDREAVQEHNKDGQMNVEIGGYYAQPFTAFQDKQKQELAPLTVEISRSHQNDQGLNDATKDPSQTTDAMEVTERISDIKETMPTSEMKEAVQTIGDIKEEVKTNGTVQDMLQSPSVDDRNQVEQQSESNLVSVPGLHTENRASGILSVEEFQANAGGVPVTTSNHEPEIVSQKINSSKDTGFSQTAAVQDDNGAQNFKAENMKALSDGAVGNQSQKRNSESEEEPPEKRTKS